jgi:hypothetical protein
VSPADLPAALCPWKYMFTGFWQFLKELFSIKTLKDPKIKYNYN